MMRFQQSTAMPLPICSLSLLFREKLCLQLMLRRAAWRLMHELCGDRSHQGVPGV